MAKASRLLVKAAYLFAVYTTPSGRRSVVLLVDDHDAVRAVAEITLKALGYEVHTAVSGAEALARWAELQDKVELVITDFAMPGGMDGLALLSRLREKKPGLKAIITTGSEDDSLSAAVRSDPRQGILHKPYSSSELHAAIRQLLGPPGADRPMLF